MAGSLPLYDELRIRFEPDGDECYRTVATATDGSTAVATFQVPFTELELDNFVLRVGRQRPSARNYRIRQMDEARQFGERLFDALMVEAQGTSSARPERPPRLQEKVFASPCACPMRRH